MFTIAGKSTPRLAIGLLVALGMTLGMTLTGCSTGSDSPAPPAPQSDTDDSGTPAENDGDADAESDVDSEKIPAWVTDNFPIYPGSNVSTVSESGSSIIIGMMTSDDGDTVKAWYNEQYSQNGWEQDLVQDDGRFNAFKGDFAAVVGYVTTSTATIVTLTATKI